MQDGRRAHWEDVYATKPVDAVSWYQARPSTSLALIARTGLGRDMSVVDVGGGASNLAGALLDAGVSDVTVLDLSDTALARAKERLGAWATRVSWIAADVTRWTASRTFDVWHDRALFHFLTDEGDREAYRRAMGAAVRVGGQVIIGTFAADGPEMCSGLRVVKYDAEGIAAALGPRYRLIESLVDEHATPAGTLQRFQFCRLERLDVR